MYSDPSFLNLQNQSLLQEKMIPEPGNGFLIELIEYI